MCLDKKGNSNTGERISIIEKFVSLFGVEKIKYLTADREFIGFKWFTYLLNKCIHFRIRVKDNFQVTSSKGKQAPIKALFRNEPRYNQVFILINTDYGQRFFSEEFLELRSKSRIGEKTFLDPYGAANEAEFFAVATEFFFDKPLEMQKNHKALYDVLSGFYMQDTAERELHSRNGLRVKVS